MSQLRFSRPWAKSDEERILMRCIPEPNSGCWLWEGAVWEPRKGWLLPNVCHGGRGKKVLASRLSYSTFKGPIAEGMLVCHRCDNPLCVNPDHLFLGTPRDNVIDMVVKGRHRSPAPGWKRCTPEMRAIFADAKLGETKGLAKRYGVSEATVRYHRTKAEAA